MALKSIDNYDQITLDLARKYAETWQDTCDLKAFLFHRNDIECILSEQNAEAVRFYMGIKEEGENRCPDMMVVGVNSIHKDIISIAGLNSGIYNFTMPCPRTCDILSRLFFNTGPSIIGGGTCAIPAEGRTVSTKTECNISGYEIAVTDASDATYAWQTLFNLKSVLFKKEDLTKIFAQYEVDQIRVYFGIDTDEKERIILVGVDSEGKDVFRKNEMGAFEDLYINSTSLCTKNSVTTCSVLSPLYHVV